MALTGRLGGLGRNDSWLVFDDVVRHTAGQRAPHLAGHTRLDLADTDTELEELLHRTMETRPLATVLVVAGVEERHAPATGLFELVGQLAEHLHDLRLVLFEPTGVETDIGRDARRLHVIGSVFAVLEQASKKRLLDALCAKRLGRGIHLQTSWLGKDSSIPTTLSKIIVH